MFGLKENVIIGKLIPAGTGFGVESHPSRDVPSTDTEEDEEFSGSQSNLFKDVFGKPEKEGPINLESLPDSLPGD